MDLAGSAEPEQRQDWPLWGGTARLVVRAGADPEGAGWALTAARDEVDAVVQAVDRACSRFRSDSEVMTLATAAGSEQRVSEVLGLALAAALRAADLTGGAVDPTLGHALVAAGYDRDIGEVVGGDTDTDTGTDAEPATDEVPRPAPVVRRVARWRDIELDLGRGTVRVPDGVLLDLGATAKAFAADRAAAAVHASLGVPVLVSLCGDIAVAGTRQGRPWLVLVVERPDQTAGPLVQIHDGGLATSTTQARRWYRSGRPMHHLLDPLTGLPVREVWRTVTVAAASCLDANTASTATVVKGSSGLAWLESTGLPARLVAADGTVRGVGGWPAGSLHVST
jgi:FAD:protein FMN transferase